MDTLSGRRQFRRKSTIKSSDIPLVGEPIFDETDNEQKLGFWDFARKGFIWTPALRRLASVSESEDPSTTDFPVGTCLMVKVRSTYGNRCEEARIRLSRTSTKEYTTEGYGAILKGQWVARGAVTDTVVQYERIN